MTRAITNSNLRHLASTWVRRKISSHNEPTRTNTKTPTYDNEAGMLQYLPMATVALLLGGECTGKTALAAALAERIDTQRVHVVPEALREFTRQTGRPPVISEQDAIWLRQMELLADARQSSEIEDLVVCDPAPLMTAVYSVQYFDDYSLLAPALEATDPADVLVLCSPDIPWEPDGIQRDGPAARRRTHDLLRELVLPAVHNELVVASGPLHQRVTQVMDALA